MLVYHWLRDEFDIDLRLVMNSVSCDHKGKPSPPLTTTKVFFLTCNRKSPNAFSVSGNFPYFPLVSHGRRTETGQRCLKVWLAVGYRCPAPIRRTLTVLSILAQCSKIPICPWCFHFNRPSRFLITTWANYAVQALNHTGFAQRVSLFAGVIVLVFPDPVRLRFKSLTWHSLCSVYQLFLPFWITCPIKFSFLS